MLGSRETTQTHLFAYKQLSGVAKKGGAVKPRVTDNVLSPAATAFRPHRLVLMKRNDVFGGSLSSTGPLAIPSNFA